MRSRMCAAPSPAHMLLAARYGAGGAHRHKARSQVHHDAMQCRRGTATAIHVHACPRATRSMQPALVLPLTLPQPMMTTADATINMACPMCMFVVTKVKDGVDYPANPGAVNLQTTAACDLMPTGAMRDMCKTWASTHGAQECKERADAGTDTDCSVHLKCHLKCRLSAI